jgi:hypothetical protein
VKVSQVNHVELDPGSNDSPLACAQLSSQDVDLDVVISIATQTSGILVKSAHGALHATDDNKHEDDDAQSTRSHVSLTSLKSALTDATADNKRPTYSRGMVRACLGTLICVNAVARGVLAIVEAVGTPLYITVALTSPDGVKEHNAARV